MPTPAIIIAVADNCDVLAMERAVMAKFAIERLLLITPLPWIICYATSVKRALRHQFDQPSSSHSPSNGCSLLLEKNLVLSQLCNMRSGVAFRMHVQI